MTRKRQGRIDFVLSEAEDRSVMWFWRIRAANGMIVADGAEGYSTAAKARHGFEVALRIGTEHLARQMRERREGKGTK